MIEPANDIVREALTWLNTPYHHQGSIKGVGVDCAMILIEIFQSLEYIPKIDPRPYPPDWHKNRDTERYLGWVEKYADKVDSVMPGDVALFKYGRCISHGGIVIEWPIILHAVKQDGKVILSNVDANIDLSKRLKGFYRVRAIR
jgi:cell wall-associated NlpC family hydrolase